jgi:hypothetical protein
MYRDRHRSTAVHRLFATRSSELARDLPTTHRRHNRTTSSTTSATRSTIARVIAG